MLLIHINSIFPAKFPDSEGIAPFSRSANVEVSRANLYLVDVGLKTWEGEGGVFGKIEIFI